MLIYLTYEQGTWLPELQAYFPGLVLQHIERQAYCYAAPLAQGRQAVEQVQFLRRHSIRHKDDEYERATWIRSFFQQVALGRRLIEKISLWKGEERHSYEVLLKNRAQEVHLSFPASWRGGEEIAGRMEQWIVVQARPDGSIGALGVSASGSVEETLHTTSSAQEMSTWLCEKRCEQWICTTEQWSVHGIYRHALRYVFP